MATKALDIISEWYSNGVQVYDFPKLKEPVELFSLNPNVELNETWGVLEIKWVKNNVILAKGVYDNWKAMTNDTIYKKIQFSNVREQRLKFIAQLGINPKLVEIKTIN
jgi:hypothetical protein